ncbi:NADH:ubiquinone oxidoreductase subunit 5 (chain L)/multisubunit Na+/H+ antiporter, MnhA subunit [Aequorivita sublithincola DSM 14238]|uniref:NADH:ubiquinone oxidoreductase subunit 5 (Chain L)/multisubunit Na+/H+ antiporter, MnhA subunit n=1 Tax=Aequorivita sublithincola (strain DSM 14238 / LMG 21431 / ACAM 643 / 9-3) TaxID=746697 RepID=I3YZ64_AEQSU|nr:proton-conducting transporter membrane subunit [Aequorivita sublithincola]AFL82282.1 NADH:ubiquinone oxidoreductase subunit 5 (chain L)/multisubunit Na+/H+ antiporter, MnhA subunit [Aequorivita sublithincola DSM 14238]
MQAILNQSNLKQTLPKQKSFHLSKIYTIVPIFLWVLFFTNLFTILYYLPNTILWQWNDIFKINGFTILIWTTVTFFSAIVSTYARNYLNGFTYHLSFTINSLGFLFSVMLLLMSNHILLFVSSWLFMGIFMAKLIGINKSWAEAREAARYAQKFFLLGTFFLGAGLLLLATQTNMYYIDGIIQNLSSLPTYITVMAAIFIIMAAIIQSAMYPFQRWLLSAMTSPTPASALMHAGFVNGAGILLAFFSTLFFESHTFTLLFIIGGITAVTAQFTKLLQVNVKQKLACSTIAQMGFMIMQCGLGFFNAAVAHLILHGFYKAYLFLSAGEEIKNTNPVKPYKIVITPVQALVVLIFGAIGAVLFSYLTGKSTSMDSGIILTLIVAITVGQVTYNIVKQEIFNSFQKIIYPILLFTVGIILYALLYNAVTFLMGTMPMVDAALPISATHIIFGIIFLIGFFIMKLGIYRRWPWLYAKLLNDSQPYKKSILTSNKKSL